MKTLRAFRCEIAVALSCRYDWLYWNARWAWSQTINDFLLRQIK